MEKKYDVFISYRRDGGESTAKILRDKLTEQGYRVFLDVESLRSGDFNTKLYSVIDECADFLLVLSPGALERCQREDDWVRLEIERALEKEKNIIPIMLRGFSFPKELPASMDKLRYKNGLQTNYQFFDAFIEKLESFLKAKPSGVKRVARHPAYKRILLIIAVVLLAILGGIRIATLSHDSAEAYPQTEFEKNVTGTLLYYVENNMLQLEQAAECLDNAYRACDRYLQHMDSADSSALLAELQKNRRLLYQMDLDDTLMSEELKNDLSGSPFSAADAIAMHDYLETFRESSIENIYYMEYLTGQDAYHDQETREKVLDYYREILSEELKLMAYCVNELLLPIENEEVLKEFKYEFLPQLYYIQLQASDWNDSKEVLQGAEDKSWNTIYRVMNGIATEIGEANMELMQQKYQRIQELMEQGASEEEAEQIVESLLGNVDLITEQEVELWQMNKEMEEKLEEAKKKFAPTADDDGDLLWGKMLRFMNLGLYDEALTCIDMYREKMRAEDEYAQEYCAAVVRFIKNISKTGIDYGLIVTGYEPDKPKNEQYVIGDVIISVGGVPCHNYDEYSTIRQEMPESEDYYAVVLREKGDGTGELEQIELFIPADASKVQIREMTEKTYE